MSILAVLIALVIVVQPVGDIGYISPDPAAVTEYSYVGQWGVRAYLAHDYLAGSVFKSLEFGDRIFVDGQGYQVSEIVVLAPSAEEQPLIFEQYYGDGGIGDNGRLVLQTCSGAGFYFVIADPVGEFRREYIGMFIIGRHVDAPVMLRPIRHDPF